MKRVFLVADVVQQLAVLGHGLGHVLDDLGFHISIPPNVSVKIISILRPPRGKL